MRGGRPKLGLIQQWLYYRTMAFAPTDLVLGRIGKALSDPTRCRILLCLLDGPHYPSELAAHLSLTKANVSNHLACLRGCGLVKTVQEGRRVRYEYADARLAHALHDLADLALSITASRSVDRMEAAS